MNQPPAEIGAAIADIDTPALVVDLDALDRERMTLDVSGHYNRSDLFTFQVETKG